MTEDLLKEFFEVAFPVLETKDELKIHILIDTIEKMKILKQTQIQLIKNICLSYLHRIYYQLLQNNVYLEVNQKNKNLFLSELKVILFLKKCYPIIKETENREQLFLFLKLLECINDIENLRIDYENENGNPGRIMASSYHLEQLNALLNEKDNLQQQLKRVLEQKN